MHFASAANITVNTGVDSIPAPAGLCNLRDAIRSINTGSNIGNCTGSQYGTNDTIILEKGTPLFFGNGEAFYISSFNPTSFPNIQKSVTITGEGKTQTHIMGLGFGRAFSTIGTTIKIQDLTLESFDAGQLYGGVIYNKGNLTLEDIIIQNNNSNLAGGAIFNEGILIVSNSEINNNTAQCGGAIAVSEGTESSPTLTIKDSYIHDNKALHCGGAIDATAKNKPPIIYIENSILSFNEAEVGGAITNFVSEITIKKSKFISNKSQHDGGGIYSYSLPGETDFILNIFDSTFDSNIAEGGTGGAILNAEPGNTIISGSTFSNNQAIPLNLYESEDPQDIGEKGGGAIYNSYGRLEITNSTFNGNAAIRGSAILNDFGGGDVDIQFSTFSDNDFISTNAPLVKPSIIASEYNFPNYSENYIKIKSSIIKGYESMDNCDANIISHGYNISTDKSCNFTGIADLETVDPMLGSFNYHGGTTKNYSLLKDSPAIDLASCKLIGFFSPADLKIDQRGKERPKDGNNDGIAKCDSGAFEGQQYPRIFTDILEFKNEDDFDPQRTISILDLEFN